LAPRRGYFYVISPLFRIYLGAALRSARAAQGRTLSQVALRAGISLGYLSEVERGVKEVSSEMLASICDALGVPLSHVLTVAARGALTSETESSAAMPLAA